MNPHAFKEYCPVCDWHKDINPNGGALHAECPGCGHQDKTWNTHLGLPPTDTPVAALPTEPKSDFLRIEAVIHRKAYPDHLCTTCIDPKNKATDLFIFSDQFHPPDLGLCFTRPNGSLRFCWFEAGHVTSATRSFQRCIAFCDKNNSQLADTVIRYYIWLDLIDEDHDYYDEVLAKDVEEALAEEK